MFQVNAINSLGTYILVDNMSNIELSCPEPEADAGENMVLTCDNFTTLSANAPTNDPIGGIMTGSWSILSGYAEFSSLTDPNANITNIQPGENIFEWTVSDACNSNSSEVIITFQNTTSTIQNISNYNGFNTSCEGINDGYIEITAVGGYPPYSFNWSGPNSFYDTNQDIFNLAPGTYNLTKAFIKNMVKNKNGRIINISSVSGLMGNAGQVNYSSSKAALNGFTKSLAKEIGSRNITCLLYTSPSPRD